MFKLTHPTQPTHGSSSASTSHTKTLGYLLNAKGKKDLPKKPIHLLKEPTIYRACIEDLNGSDEGRYLQSLINRNIIQENGTPLDLIISLLRGAEVKALYHFLSDEYKPKFAMLVKAFAIAVEKDPRTLQMIKGEIDEGGEIRVIATVGADLVENALTDAAGIRLNEFYGVSAGGFLAASGAVRSLNSSIVKTTVNTNFERFYRNRERLTEWINGFMSEGYHFSTGKHVSNITLAHLQELNSDLQILVAEPVRGNLMWPRTFEAENYFLPAELERRFRKDPLSFELATAVAAGANIPGLFYWPWDKTFGNCHLEGFDERYLFDPGYKREDMCPTQKLEEGVRKYVNGESELPPFYFILRNQRANTGEILEADLKQYITMLKEVNGLTGMKDGFIHSLFPLINKWIDWADADPKEKLDRLGVNKSCIISKCNVRDNNDTLAMLLTGYLKVPRQLKEILITSNIQIAIDQLMSLVDPVYVESNGEKGKSPMQLYIDDVNKAHGIGESYKGNGQHTDRSRLLASTRQISA